MTVIKINAITVPENSGDELARRFAKRAGSVDGFDGFEGFELLQPTDGRNTWLVVTRWRDEASFDAWLQSKEFGAAHGQPSGGGEAATGGHPGGGHGAGHGGGHGHGGADGDQPAEKPVGMSAELWSFNIADLSS